MAVDFVEDPISHIVSITIEPRGGIFVVKTDDSEIFYGRAGGSAEESDEWPQWSETWDIYGIVSNSGSSSALLKDNEDDPGTPVWVVSARKDSEGDDPAGGSIILYSEDGGATWDLVFERYEVPLVDGDASPDQHFPTGIVWDEDEQAFFASFYTRDQHIHEGEIDNPQGEEIWSSANGRSWSLVSRTLTLPPGGDLATTPSDIFAWCNKPENQNRSGGDQKIPDGLQGYSTSTGTFIRPSSLAGFDPYNGARYEGVPTPSVTRIDVDDIETVIPVNVVGCYAVAHHNGVWLAVGGDPAALPGGTAIAVSFDDGQSWSTVFANPSTYPAVTVSGQREAPTP